MCVWGRWLCMVELWNWVTAIRSFWCINYPKSFSFDLIISQNLKRSIYFEFLRLRAKFIMVQNVQCAKHLPNCSSWQSSKHLTDGPCLTQLSTRPRRVSQIRSQNATIHFSVSSNVYRKGRYCFFMNRLHFASFYAMEVSFKFLSGYTCTDAS